jgi:uncharacterized protein YrrD
MNVGDLKGRAVVTLSDAAKVGSVDDVLFDAQYREVLGFRVKKGGLLSGTEALLRSNVSAVGADAITVPSPDAINAEERFAELAGAAAFKQAQGTRVVTEGGTLLGTVDEVELDDQARAVTAYILNAPLLDRIRHKEPRVAAQDVQRLGEGGIMIVSDAVAEAIQGS